MQVNDDELRLKEASKCVDSVSIRGDSLYSFGLSSKHTRPNNRRLVLQDGRRNGGHRVYTPYCSIFCSVCCSAATDCWGRFSADSVRRYASRLSSISSSQRVW